MTNIMKIRAAWSRPGKQAGAIISLPVSILQEAGLSVGDSVNIVTDGNQIILQKIVIKK